MIEVRGLTKRYGSTLAVDDLSFDVLPGRVTGFLGPNGAGKSTTMRMILGLDHPSSGTVRVLGKPYAQCRRPLYEVGAVLESRGRSRGTQRVQPPALPRAEQRHRAGPGRRGAPPSSDCRMWDADEPVACRSA
jgi:ABC-2 type transport system ATP-binding protein